jgi:hypothetical protein
MAEQKPRYESVEHRFTGKELLALGKQLAAANQEVYRLRGEQKAVQSQMAAAVKGAEAHAAELSRKIENERELREVEVSVLMDTPRRGLKTIVRVDNGEEVRTDQMTNDERQQSLNFEGRAQ